MHPCLSVISLTCLFATPLLFPNIFRTIQYELSKICWSLLEVIRLRGDSQQTSDRLTLNPTAEICWRWHQVSIWRAVQISSPNLESFPNQLSKFGYHQTTDRPLTDSWHTSDRLQTYFVKTNIKPNSRNFFVMMTLCLNLESCLNKLSKFGKVSKSALRFIFPTNIHQTTKQALKNYWMMTPV